MSSWCSLHFDQSSRLSLALFSGHQPHEQAKCRLAATVACNSAGAMACTFQQQTSLNHCASRTWRCSLSIQQAVAVALMTNQPPDQLCPGASNCALRAVSLSCSWCCAQHRKQWFKRRQKLKTESWLDFEGLPLCHTAKCRITHSTMLCSACCALHPAWC